jgi:hypothetical protein
MMCVVRRGIVVTIKELSQRAAARICTHTYFEGKEVIEIVGRAAEAGKCLRTTRAIQKNEALYEISSPRGRNIFEQPAGRKRKPNPRTERKSAVRVAVVFIKKDGRAQQSGDGCLERGKVR